MSKVLESRMSPEGRVSIPVELRQKLGLEPGARVKFIITDDGEIRLSTARLLAEQIWANNTGGDAVDATELVRAARAADDERHALWDLASSEQPEPTESEAELIASLFPGARR